MREQNVGCRMFGKVGVYRRTIDCVSARRISAVGPINEAVLQIELEIDLLRSERFTLSDDGCTILAVEISTLDRTIVPIRNAHVGPVNLSGLNIDDDAIRDSSTADNHFSFRSIGVSRMNPATACFE